MTKSSNPRRAGELLSGYNLRRCKAGIRPAASFLKDAIMEQQEDGSEFGRFDVKAIANGFPDTAETLLLDTYLTDEQAASVRVFRV
jgi:hypothetical protein